MRRGGASATTEDRLDKLRGKSKRQSTNVRALARFAANSSCTLARVGFAARVDFDYLLEGTRLQAPFGQSPFAFRRGNQFEDRLRADGHAPLLALLQEGLKYDPTDAKVVNLRDGRPTPKKLAARAERTRDLVAKIVKGGRSAPNLLDGAVLAKSIGGGVSHFEADAVAARFNGPIHVGEVKSFPTVDGQADPEKVGAAISQAAIYMLLLRELVDSVGGDPGLVSPEALLITPKNTGLQPTLTVKLVGREIERAARIFDNLEPVDDIVDDLPARLPSFEKISPKSHASEVERIDTALHLVDKVGNAYTPNCLASCGLGRLCRERAHRSGAPERFGGQLQRLVPGVASIDRAGVLAAGARPRRQERDAAERLVQTQALLELANRNGKRRGR